MKSALVAAAFLALPAPLQGQIDELFPVERQRLSGDLLRQSGTRRLSDIFRLIDDWSFSSVDGFFWDPSPRGLAPFGQGGWRVFAGRQMLDPDLFGVTNLNRLPIGLGQIDSIEIVSLPELANGEFLPVGGLQLHLRRPRPGLAVRARLATADETGDPGPYRFTELATPNIDRIGTGVSGTISLGAPRAFLEVGGAYREHFVTDPLVRARNFDISEGDYPIIKSGALSLRAIVEAGGGSHSLLAGYSGTRDYFFLKQFGRELPAESPFAHVGVDGELPAGSLRLRYRAAFSSTGLKKHRNTLDLDYDFRLDTWTAALEAVAGRSSYRTTVGAGFRKRSAATGYALTDDDMLLISAYGELAYRLSASHRQRLTGYLTAGEGDAALKAAWAHRWLHAPGQALEVAVSWVERLPVEDRRIWPWQRRGYRFLTDNGVEVAGLEQEPRTARTLTADARWRHGSSPGAMWELGAYVRAHRGQLLEVQSFSFDTVTQSFSGPVELLHGKGEIGGFDARAQWQLDPHLRLTAYYRYQHRFGGDRGFERNWRTVPRHLAKATVRFEPINGLTFWGMARYRSSSYWEDYAAAAQQTGDRYRAQLSEVLLLDAAVQKWLWQRRIRLQMILLNLLNDPQPQHPIGAAYGLSIAVQLEVLTDGN